MNIPMTMNPQKLMNMAGELLAGRNPQAVENFREMLNNNKALVTELLGGAFAWAMKKDEMFRVFVEGVIEDSIKGKECRCSQCLSFDKKLVAEEGADYYG